MPTFAIGDDPGSSFPELLRRVGLHPLDERCPHERHGRTHARTLGAARHHLRRAALRQRRGHGGRPPGHRRQPDLPSHDGEGRPGRSPQRRGHRRNGRPGDRDDPPVPAAARALREGRGVDAQPRGQGQPAVDDGARQPAGGDAGHGRRADLRRLRRTRGDRSAVGLRRHRRPVRRARLRGHRLRQPARRHRHQGRLATRRSTATRRSNLAARALWEAADSDSATGGPDMLRGIYPVVATIDVDGWQRLDDEELAQRFGAIIDEVRSR